MEMTSDINEGQAAYTRFNMSVRYDIYVLLYSNRFVWKCPTPKQLRMYNEHVSANHLDIGVGTGYYLDKCRFPSSQPRLALMDLNPNSLERAATRTARYKPEVYQRNVLAPISVDAPGFDSIGMNYLLHCLPGSMSEKAVVFDHIRPLLNPGGCVFGSTVMQGGVSPSARAQRLMVHYNQRGIFHNDKDSVAELEKALSQRFSESRVTVHGCVALFWAKS
ncbi:MAG: class I SAM-dependent methyltransferase [Archangium sp.]